MARRKRKVVRDGQEGGSKTSDFFQHSHLISNIGEYALPALGGVAGAAGR